MSRDRQRNISEIVRRSFIPVLESLFDLLGKAMNLVRLLKLLMCVYIYVAKP